MSDLPLLTCVIAVFNGERYLPQAIESVLAQDTAGEHGGIQIIVVDDGSTDGTRQAAERFGSVVTYLQQANAGPSSARNRGIGQATGRFLAFLDADDLWHPNKLAVQLAAFAADPDLAACTAHVRNFLSPDADAATGALADPMVNATQPGTASTFMARRSLFATVGMLNPDYRHRDIQDLLVRATDQGLKTRTLTDVLVNRRIHGHNMSWSRSGEDQLELLAITRATLARRRANRA